MKKKRAVALATILTVWLSFVNTRCEGQEMNQLNSVYENNLPTDQGMYLINEALEARKMSYSPYSNFKVGAALLATNGTVYRGTNVENASYGLACCAERTAVFKAVSEGVKEFKAIAVVSEKGASPCGACRQVLNEFNPDMLILISDEYGSLVKEITVKELLPDGFGPIHLGK